MSAEKLCARCGRVFAWRKKWAANWDGVRYCSERCRRSKLGETDGQLEEAIVSLLQSRAAGATICPSEAARAVFAGESWRDRMEQTRRAGRRLVLEGRLEWTQRGRVVDPSTARGAVRFRLKKSPGTQ